MKEIFLDCCGYFCTILTLISYLPQFIKIIRTKHADDIAISSWVLWTLSTFIWLAYALVDGSKGLIVAQVIETIMIVLTLVFSIKYGNSRKGG